MSGSLAFDDQLCVALYSASRAIVGRYREGLSKLGLTYTQYVVLLALWEEPHTTTAALGQRLQLDSGTLSPLIKRMEGMGLVTRRRSQRDERVLEVELTPAGEALREPVSQVQCDVSEATGMGDAELKEMREQLRELAEHLRALD